MCDIWTCTVFHLMSKYFPNSNRKKILITVKSPEIILESYVRRQYGISVRIDVLQIMKPNSEFIDPRIYSQLIFSSEAKVIQWLEQLNVHIEKKIEPQPLPQTVCKKIT